jgi:hypothetical protein
VASNLAEHAADLWVVSSRASGTACDQPASPGIKVARSSTSGADRFRLLLLVHLKIYMLQALLHFALRSCYLSNGSWQAHGAMVVTVTTRDCRVSDPLPQECQIRITGSQKAMCSPSETEFKKKGTRNQKMPKAT